MLSGALLVMALSVAIFARKPMTAEEALILRNVEAIAQDETGNGYIPCVVGDSVCEFTVQLADGTTAPAEFENLKNVR